MDLLNQTAYEEKSFITKAEHIPSGGKNVTRMIPEMLKIWREAGAFPL